MTRYIACLTFDFDAMSGWNGARHDHADPDLRGNSALVGASRILALLEKSGLGDLVRAGRG